MKSAQCGWYCNETRGTTTKEKIMAQSILQNHHGSTIKVDTNRILLALSATFLVIVGLAILQDLAESIRSGYAFYFSESLLFKTIWFLFIPILTILYSRLECETLNSLRTTMLYIVGAIIIHFGLLLIVGFVLSRVFFEGSYDMYKWFSYTLARDFSKLIVIYTVFVLVYKAIRKKSATLSHDKSEGLNKLVITNGKENTVVSVEAIAKITSATPYIFIHLENRKYLYKETLTAISQRLDLAKFVRVHKTVVVNIEKVQSFKSRMNGDYDLRLKNGDTVRLSRTYASNFKMLFKKGTQDTV